MPDDSSQTQFLTKNGNGGSSRLFGVTIKDWTAIMVIGTVCLIHAAGYVFVSYGITSENTKIEEPLYGGFLLCLGYLFGKATSPTTTK